MLKIENMTDDVLRIHTKEFAANELWEIPDSEVPSWSVNGFVATAIGVGSLRVWDGDAVITGVASQLAALREYGSRPPSGSVVWRASSVLTDTEKDVSSHAPDWTELGGTVTTPSFFTVHPERCRGRVVGQYRADGPVKIRLIEDRVEPKAPEQLASTDGEWSVMQWFTSDFVSGPGTHSYVLEGQLGEGASLFSVKFVACSLLEFT